MKRAFIAGSIAVALVLCAVGSASAETKGEFGGHDAYGLVSNKQIPTDCKISWEDSSTKKIYCFSSEATKADFAKDTAGNIAKAEANFKHSSAQTATPEQGASGASGATGSK